MVFMFGQGKWMNGETIFFLFLLDAQSAPSDLSSLRSSLFSNNVVLMPFSYLCRG